eukprot:TRINITY_DN27354_c0_g1_i1.p1 TRINITY_DN27354_c0_g1~~TRINITY_DN27354_c0_g1_i1.p1  ORF type:complete len:490 (-),score=74.58 TRINITY_DN27354_c0_g1_i1:131-1600(-)
MRNGGAGGSARTLEIDSSDAEPSSDESWAGFTVGARPSRQRTQPRRSALAAAGMALIGAGLALLSVGAVGSVFVLEHEPAPNERASDGEESAGDLESRVLTPRAVLQRDFNLFRRGFACPRGSSVPSLWKPPAPKQKLAVKILTYNLYWWNLFGVNKGRSGSAGKLIAGSNSPPYDVMGFQECEDPALVLGPADLMDQFQSIQGAHAMCMAYRKSAWVLIRRGEADVAEDQSSEHYGTRGAQWMRLRHKQTSQTLLFVNHHGPLSVNSGGKCGGEATAHNLVRLIASKGQEGDIIVLVGDFNANAQSTTIQELWRHIVLAYNGDSFGGVDNIFSNAGSPYVASPRTLGTGGSDHNAVSAIIEVGGPPPQPLSVWSRLRTAGQREPSKALRDARGSQCGLLEENVEYVFPPDTSRPAQNIKDPRSCCSACKGSCRAWVFWPENGDSPRCWLKYGSLVRKQARSGAVSGLPTWEAQKLAVEASSRAASFMR